MNDKWKKQGVYAWTKKYGIGLIFTAIIMTGLSVSFFCLLVVVLIAKFIDKIG